MRQSRDAKKRPRKRELQPCSPLFGPSRCGTLQHLEESRGSMSRRGHREQDGKKQARSGLVYNRVRA